MACSLRSIVDYLFWDAAVGGQGVIGFSFLELVFEQLHVQSFGAKDALRWVPIILYMSRSIGWRKGAIFWPYFCKGTCKFQTSNYLECIGTMFVFERNGKRRCSRLPSDKFSSCGVNCIRPKKGEQKQRKNLMTENV